MTMPRCETCGRELEQGETVYQGGLSYDLSVFPPTVRVEYWCEQHGQELVAKQLPAVAP